MYRALSISLSVLLVSCVTAPSYQNLQGGERVEQPGVSFVLPTGQKWSAIMRSTYQIAFGALGMPKNDTVIVSSTVYNIDPPASKEEFLKTLQKRRSSEPNTGRFEVIQNTEQVYEDRSETCVIYRSASKDFGAEAKRGGQYSVLEMLGMHCVHPDKPNIGIQVEFSRKAPPETTYPQFENTGLTILQSVKFGEF
ncbi:MAG: hypothetical protein C4519_18620 [Desulfobacteraceae bacterium]|nr:MAG: hypothetical protein C4519_18620 [Desulfobacteraceae bacterium]